MNYSVDAIAKTVVLELESFLNHLNMVALLAELAVNGAWLRLLPIFPVAICNCYNSSLVRHVRV